MKNNNRVIYKYGEMETRVRRSRRRWLLRRGGGYQRFKIDHYTRIVKLNHFERNGGNLWEGCLRIQWNRILYRRKIPSLLTNPLLTTNAVSCGMFLYNKYIYSKNKRKLLIKEIYVKKYEGKQEVP